LQSQLRLHPICFALYSYAWYPTGGERLQSSTYDSAIDTKRYFCKKDYLSYCCSVTKCRGSNISELTAGEELEQAMVAALHVLIVQEPKQGKEKEPSPTAHEEEKAKETAYDSSYPDMCIPPPPPDSTCDDISARNYH
jgi:hypothetical protein